MPANFRELWSDEFLNHKRSLADQPADLLIEQLVNEKGKGEAKKVFDILIRNIDLPLSELPESVRQFIASTNSLPDWADPDKMKTAQQLFVDHGPKFLTFLYYKSLPLLYACANGAQVLEHTGRLAHKEDKHIQFSRRIAETGQFLLNVMVPGGFDNGGNAIQTIQKVRLVHAAIRNFIPREHWDAEKLGVPINQEDMAGTLMTFSVSLLDGLHQFDIPANRKEEEAYMHHWRVIGHLMGLNEDLLPDSPEEGRFLLEKVLQRQTAPSEAGVVLTKALIRFTKENLHADFFPKVPEVTMQYLIGDEKAAMLGVETRNGCITFLLPGFVKSAFKMVERLEDRSEPVQIILDKISLIIMEKSVQYFNTYKGQKFRIPEKLRKAWKL